MLTGLLSAVLIPNLLSARTAALTRAHQAYASSTYKSVMAQWAETGQLPTQDDCLRGAGTYTVEPLADALSCTIDRSNLEHPGVTVTFKDGATLSLP